MVKIGGIVHLTIQSRIDLVDTEYIRAVSVIPEAFRPSILQQASAPILSITRPSVNFDSDIAGRITVEATGTIYIFRNADNSLNDRWNNITDGFDIISISYYV